MQISEELEEMRIFSEFTESIHYIQIASEHYVCVNGISMPYNIGMIYIIWALGAPPSNICISDDEVECLLLKLNANNADFSNFDKHYTRQFFFSNHIFNKVNGVILKLTLAGELNNIIPNAEFFQKDINILGEQQHEQTKTYDYNGSH